MVGGVETDLLTEDRLVQVLLDLRGSRKDCPPGARFAVLINRVRDEDRRVVDEVRRLVAARDPSVAVVAMADLPVGELPDSV